MSTPEARRARHFATLSAKWKLVECGIRNLKVGTRVANLRLGEMVRVIWVGATGYKAETTDGRIIKDLDLKPSAVLYADVNTIVNVHTLEPMESAE